MREKEKQKGGDEGIYDRMGEIKVWEKRGKGVVGELEKDSIRCNTRGCPPPPTPPTPPPLGVIVISS